MPIFLWQLPNMPFWVLVVDTLVEVDIVIEVDTVVVVVDSDID